MLKINAINKDEWVQDLTIVDFGGKVVFKLDTGAQCNVIPVKVCKE